MSEKHVWWLLNGSTRQMIAAYYDARTGVLKEMTLPKCIEVSRSISFFIIWDGSPTLTYIHPFFLP